MIPLCSRFDSVLFTPKMSAIASCGNYSRFPKDNVAGFEYALARSNPLIFHGNLSGIGDDGMVIPFHQFQPPTKRKRCEKFTPCLYKRATALLIRIKLLVGPAE
jgi:hypothetical protein